MTYILNFLAVVLAINTACFAKPDSPRHPIDTIQLAYQRNLNDEGLCYWKEGDYVNAEKCFRKSADSKYSWGRYNLALCYFHGRGVTKDLTKAASLMRLAATQGNQEAQGTLGTMYHYGMGVDQNYTEAFKWYQLAAKGGNSESLTYLGYLYQFGLGVPQNYCTAYDWYQKAADKGCGNAMLYLGGLYENGKGVDKDLKEALKWYRIAADQSLSEASYRAFRIYYYDLSDSANGYNYLARAATQNHTAALYELAEVYYFGLLGRTVDRTKALQYYKKAADGGNTLAHTKLQLRSTIVSD